MNHLPNEIDAWMQDMINATLPPPQTPAEVAVGASNAPVLAVLIQHGAQLTVDDLTTLRTRKQELEKRHTKIREPIKKANNSRVFKLALYMQRKTINVPISADELFPALLSGLEVFNKSVEEVQETKKLVKQNLLDQDVEFDDSDDEE